jgi:ABC-type bacteriocin/lantibiotic exporter with double-glycine peptidase domain
MLTTHTAIISYNLAGSKNKKTTRKFSEIFPKFWRSLNILAEIGIVPKLIGTISALYSNFLNCFRDNAVVFTLIGFGGGNYDFQNF